MTCLAAWGVEPLKLGIDVYCGVGRQPVYAHQRRASYSVEDVIRYLIH